jgi:hypothetical protein
LLEKRSFRPVNSSRTQEAIAIAGTNPEDTAARTPSGETR